MPDVTSSYDDLWVKITLFLSWLFAVLPLGFMFSTEEPSALIQEQGGPCAIIASVQVHKNRHFYKVLTCHICINLSLNAYEFVWIQCQGKLLPKLQEEEKTGLGPLQAWVVWKVDNGVHQINHYDNPVDSVTCFVYPLGGDLSSE